MCTRMDDKFCKIVLQTFRMCSVQLRLPLNTVHAMRFVKLMLSHVGLSKACAKARSDLSSQDAFMLLLMGSLFLA